MFYDSRQELPLWALQSTQTTTSQWGRWLGYGNVDIRTYIGTILFRNIAMPEQVMASCPGAAGQGPIRAVPVGTARHKKHHRYPHPQRAADRRSTLGPPKPPKAKPNAMRQFLSTMFHLRYECGGTITYRTHLVYPDEENRAAQPAAVRAILFVVIQRVEPVCHAFSPGHLRPGLCAWDRLFLAGGFTSTWTGTMIFT